MAFAIRTGRATTADCPVSGLGQVTLAKGVGKIAGCIGVLAQCTFP
jgi:hypothetical protein